MTAVQKYPRTPHLTFSPGATSDDRHLHTNDHLVGTPAVITEKMDGSGVSLHRNAVYARSKSGPPTHPSYSPLKAWHATIRHLLDADTSVYGEWCNNVHSINYPALAGLPASQQMFLFAVRDDQTGQWWPYGDVVAYTQHLGCATVPLLYQGTFTSAHELRTAVETLANRPSTFGQQREGVVIRTADGWSDSTFARQCAKWVRADHVAGQHWTRHEHRPHQQTRTGR